MSQAPGVDDQSDPAQAERDEPELDQLQRRAEGDHGERGLRQDPRQQGSEQREQPQYGPDSNGNPTYATVAGHQLGRTRHHQRHGQKGPRPTAFDAFASVL